jgi:glucose/arabinose dehydrogenase
MSRPITALAACVTVAAATIISIGAEDKAPPTWPKIALVRAAGPFANPVHVTGARDGSGRLFVVEQRGRIVIVKNGAALRAAMLDIRDRVRAGGERGLLSVAFPPSFAEKRRFYVDYTDRNGDTVIARFAMGSNQDAADPNSEQMILKIEQPYANHNGGQILFGRDGYLYIVRGDGGSAGDPKNNGQNAVSLLGKMLRIDVEGTAAPYGIPPDNPFVKKAGYRPEIWALGLRNPWRFSFDTATGEMYIADVGQDRWEEIHVQPASSRGGENYGWRILEGSHCYGAPECRREGLVTPVAEYDHALGCSVTGGFVYRGKAHPGLQGIYLYGDYCSGRIWGLRREGDAWRSQILVESGMAISSFGEDDAGEVYVAEHGSGVIYRVEKAKEDR